MEDEGQGKGTGIKEELKRLNERLDGLQKGKKKPKKFKIRRKITKQQLKQNYLNIQFHRRNGTFDFLIKPIENGMVYIPEVDAYYDYNQEDIQYHNGKPFIQLAEWHLRTFTPFKEISDEGNVEAEKIMIRATRLAELKAKKGFKLGKGFFIVIAIIVVIGLIMSALGVF